MSFQGPTDPFAFMSGIPIYIDESIPPGEVWFRSRVAINDVQRIAPHIRVPDKATAVAVRRRIVQAHKNLRANANAQR